MILKLTALQPYLYLLLLLLGYSCKDQCDLSDLVESTCTGAEGRTYKTVIFPDGSEWMAENLNTGSLNSSIDSLAYCTSDSLWKLNESPHYTQYENYSPNETAYGKLYNFKAVTAEGLCPDGFHVPSIEEWEELFECLGGPNEAGALLREANFSFWSPVDNMTSTNESRLTFRPGGFRDEEGKFYNQRFFGYYWTSSGENEEAQMISIHYASDAISEFQISTKSGASVRCMR